MELYSVKTTLEIIALCWVSYNGLRVFTSQRNSVKVGAEVPAKCPHDFAFQQYLQVREFYLQLSPAHKKYEMSGTDLLNDAVIDVWETAGFQFVKHKYKVTEMLIWLFLSTGKSIPLPLLQRFRCFVCIPGHKQRRGLVATFDHSDIRGLGTA